MDITAELAADLALLSEALDDSGADIAESTRQLASDAGIAVGSFVGLTVAQPDGRFGFTWFADDVRSVQIKSALRLPIDPPLGDPGGRSLVVILYTTRLGAFTDLAADLSWLTGSAVTEAVIEEYLVPPSASSEAWSVRVASAVDQALGVLIERGLGPEQAGTELDAQARGAGLSRYGAARAILDALPGLPQ